MDKTQQVCLSVQRVRGSIPRLNRLVKITLCCVEPPLGVTRSPAGCLASSCYPATWGQPVWRQQPFATRTAIPPFFDMDSIQQLRDWNQRPVCQTLEFHTHTTVQFTLYSVQCAVYSVKCTLNSVQCTVYSVLLYIQCSVVCGFSTKSLIYI